MNANDRVKITADALERSGFSGWSRLVDFAIRGTIGLKSDSGYVRVYWDDGELTLLTPTTAAKILAVCEPGDDSAPRHDWRIINDAGDIYACAACGDEQTEDNDLGPCRGRR